MKAIQRIQSEEVFKIIGDPTRLAILRALISQPATISQLGAVLDKHPAQIRNHLKQLEKIGFVELETILVVKNYLEKYYRATARAYFVNMAIFPEPLNCGQLVVLGSDDPALDLLSRLVNQRLDCSRLYTLPVGSLDGLIYLREHYCQMAGCHLFDLASQEYNLPYVRHLFTEQPMVLLTLSHRQQGLLVRKGNPLHIKDLTDLTRADLTFINRKRGTGTRLWLDQRLRQLGIDVKQVDGYTQEAVTHSEVAGAIVGWKADVGLGINAAASQFDLDFIPLFEEQYDLVMPVDVFESAVFQPVLEMLQSDEFKDKVNDLGGYSTVQTGKIIRT